MKKKFRIGCLAVILYCLGCSLYVGISGQGYFYFMAEMATLGGGKFSNLDRFIWRSIDIVTAPAQVAILAPLLGINCIRNHTGERGQELAEYDRQKAARARYEKLLDENFDRIYVEPEFLNPSNAPAIKALDCWTRYWHNSHGGKFTAERQRRFAEYVLNHHELMCPFKMFWRTDGLPEDLQKRALAVALEMAKKNPGEDTKWLLWETMNVSRKDVSPWREIPYTFSDEQLRGYATNENDIVRWCAQETLKSRNTYRERCRQRNETH